VSSQSGWYNYCTYICALTAPQYVNVSDVERYIFTRWNVTFPIRMDSPKAVMAIYTKQYLVIFNQTGLDNTAVGTVLTVNDTDLTFSGLPYEEWFDEGDTLVFSYHNVSSTVNGKRFILISVNATSPLNVTGPITVVGSYKTQYRLIVSISPDNLGIGNITINPAGYDQAGNGNWTSYWYDYCTYVNLTAQEKIYISANQYYPFSRWVLDSETNSSLSIRVHMDSPKNITAEYGLLATEIYTITFKVNGVGREYTGIILTVEINGETYRFTISNMSLAVFNLPANTNITFAWHSPLVASRTKAYAWYRTTGLSNKQSGTITVNSSGEIVGYYRKIKPPVVPPAGGGCKTSSKRR